jgi:hypothetical protein
MSNNSLPTTVPTRQAAAIEGRSRRGVVTGKLRTAALDLMVWSGEKRADAAEKAGLADCSLRAALRKPHVLQHYNAELAALRTSLRAKNVHRLDTIAETSKNDMARVAAVKALETITDHADELMPPGRQTMPGIQIVIHPPRAGAPRDQPDDHSGLTGQPSQPSGFARSAMSDRPMSAKTRQ